VKTIFDELRAELVSVDQWLEDLLNHPLPAKERELAERLRKYIRHCYREKKKWHSESAAHIARIKLADGWGWLYLRNSKRQAP
jgi:hypothetical protein